MPRYVRLPGVGRAKARSTLPIGDGFNKPIGRRAVSMFVGLLLVAGGMVLNMGAYSRSLRPRRQSCTT